MYAPFYRASQFIALHNDKDNVNYINSTFFMFLFLNRTLFRIREQREKKDERYSYREGTQLRLGVRVRCTRRTMTKV